MKGPREGWDCALMGQQLSGGINEMPGVRGVGRAGDGAGGAPAASPAPGRHPGGGGAAGQGRAGGCGRGRPRPAAGPAVPARANRACGRTR